MLLRRIATALAFVALIAAAPLSAARAQYYGPPCNPFPLTWPFCIAGAAVYTAGAIVTAPFRAVGYPYYYPYYRYPAQTPYYATPPYPPYYPPR